MTTADPDAKLIEQARDAADELLRREPGAAGAHRASGPRASPGGPARV